MSFYNLHTSCPDHFESVPSVIFPECSDPDPEYPPAINFSRCHACNIITAFSHHSLNNIVCSNPFCNHNTSNCDYCTCGFFMPQYVCWSCDHTAPLYEMRAFSDNEDLVFECGKCGYATDEGSTQVVWKGHYLQGLLKYSEKWAWLFPKKDPYLYPSWGEKWVVPDMAEMMRFWKISNKKGLEDWKKELEWREEERERQEEEMRKYHEKVRAMFEVKVGKK